MQTEAYIRNVVSLEAVAKYDLNGLNIDSCFIMNTKTLISNFYQSCKYQILKQTQKIEWCTHVQRFHQSKIMYNQ